MTVDSLEKAGITITHIDTETAKDIELECRELLITEALQYTVPFGDIREPGSVHPISQRLYRLSTLKESGLLAVVSVLGLHPHPEGPEATVIINGQTPGAKQVFHSDIVKGSQVVVQASKDGAFDFYPDFDPALPDNFETLDVNAGDVLSCNRAFMRHRGRNPSDHIRYNLVFTSGLLVD